jgi:hypothetical protein
MEFCNSFVSNYGNRKLSYARETVTDEKGRFVVPMARTVWLWPLSWIELDAINVYKPSYDSNPSRMQKAWSAEEKEKWRLKLNKLFPERKPGYSPISDAEYFNDSRYVPARYHDRYYASRENIKVYRPTTIRLNRAGSVEEQWEAVAVPLGGGLRDCKRHKVQKMFDVVRTEQGKLSIARRQGN